MTITTILDQLESVSEDIESLTHIPEDTKISIVNAIDETMRKLSDAQDAFGDEDLSDEEYYNED